MANAYIVNTAAINAMADALTALIDAGPTAGLIKIFAGTKPASPNVTHAELILATLTFSDPAFAPASAGVANANPITDDNDADNDGTATWFRMGDSTLTNTSAGVADGTVGLSGSDLNFNSVSFTTGSNVSITAFQITQPDGS